MQIIYAPTLRVASDALHNNAMCGYDLQVMETLLSIGDTQILYLPHLNTEESFNVAILKSLNQDRVFRIQSLQEGFGADCLVSDFSNHIFEWAFSTKKPSIAHLSGFVGIDFGDNAFYKLVATIASFSYSLRDLKQQILHLPKSNEELHTFLQKEWL